MILAIALPHLLLSSGRIHNSCTHTIRRLVSCCIAPTSPQRIILGLRETLIKRYAVQMTYMAEQDQQNKVRKRIAVGGIYGIRYSCKGRGSRRQQRRVQLSLTFFFSFFTFFLLLPLSLTHFCKPVVVCFYVGQMLVCSKGCEVPVQMIALSNRQKCCLNTRENPDIPLST